MKAGEKNKLMNPRLLKPMNELSRCFYLDSEWQDIEYSTVDIVDNTRMVYDTEGQKLLIQAEKDREMREKLVNDNPALSMIL